MLQQHLETLKDFWSFECKSIPAMCRSNAFPTEFKFQAEKPGKTFLVCEVFLMLVFFWGRGGGKVGVFLICFVLFFKICGN